MSAGDKFLRPKDEAAEEIANEGIDPVWELINEVTDSSYADLLRLTRAIQEIQDVVSDNEFYKGPGDECRPWAFTPKFEFARSDGEGNLKVPVADRKSIIKYLQTSNVRESVEAYFGIDLADFDIVAPEPGVESAIDSLEKAEALDESSLIALAERYFWSDEKYTSPSSTLGDIANNLPAEESLQLLIALEKYFPKLVDDDGCRLPIIQHISGDYSIQGGVILWTVKEEDVKHAIIHACEPLTSIHSGGELGFDDDWFDELFLEKIRTADHALHPDSNTHNAVKMFVDEMNRREDLKHKWKAA